MGGFGPNFGSNFAGIAATTTVAPVVKTVTADLCVTTSTKNELCVTESVQENLCV